MLSVEFRVAGLSFLISQKPDSWGVGEISFVRLQTCGPA
jgi:hypothetical protein